MMSSATMSRRSGGRSIKCTEKDLSADMVAVFDDLPKVLNARLSFNGKVSESHIWIQMLQKSMKSRMTSWAYAVLFEEYDPTADATHSSTEAELKRHMHECEQYENLQASAAYFFLSLISRDTTEGYTLVEMILADDTINASGSSVLNYICNRGMAITKKQVDAIKEEILKEQFAMGASLELHEATFVQIKRKFERIHPSSRGGEYALQDIMLRCVPKACEAQIKLLEQQLETDHLLYAKYPSPEELLKLLSSIVAAAKNANTNVHFGGRATGDRPKNCLNCGSQQHMSSQCDKKCPNGGGFSFCGWAAGHGCACIASELPSRILNKQGKPVPLSLYNKVKEWRVANPSKIASAAPASKVPETKVHEAPTADAYYSQFNRVAGDTPRIIMTMRAGSGTPYEHFKATPCMHAVQDRKQADAVQDGKQADACMQTADADVIEIVEPVELAKPQYMLTMTYAQATQTGPSRVMEDCKETDMKDTKDQSGITCITMAHADDMRVSSMALADSCTNTHVVRSDSVLLAGRTIPSPRDRLQIDGANEQAPTIVRGEIDLEVRIPLKGGGAIPIVLERTLVADNAPGDVIDIQMLFKQYGI